MTPVREQQRGSALIYVTMVGLVISLTFAMFMTGSVVGEERAVEAELARSRVYWAQMGDFNYALSRVSYSRLCNGCAASDNKDTDLAIVLQAYFNELNNNKTWTYPDEAAAYSFQTSITAKADDTAGRNIYSGWLMAASTYTPSSLLGASAPKAPLMELRFCTGVSGADPKCGDITHDNNGKATTQFSINRLTNLPSP